MRSGVPKAAVRVRRRIIGSVRKKSCSRAHELIGLLEGAAVDIRHRNSYLVGAGIGVLSWVVFVVVNAPIGITTALSEVSGAVATPIVGAETISTNPYWMKNIPGWDYGTLFLVGTFCGALISALATGTFRWEVVPQTWQERFGPRAAIRLWSAFFGGVLAMYGARLAGGCTSGHGISGSLQLAVSSWTFFIVMFISGLFTAQIMFRHRSRLMTAGARYDTSDSR